jgi:hypothetical protein
VYEKLEVYQVALGFADAVAALTESLRTHLRRLDV